MRQQMNNNWSKSKFGKIKAVEVINCIYNQIEPTIVGFTSLFSIDAIVSLNLDLKHIALFTGATFFVGFLKDFAKYIGSNSQGKFAKTENN